MREILFKGKRIDNGKWAYGSFAMDAMEQIRGENSGEDGFIRYYNAETKRMTTIEVDRTTVCQYTGLTDRNDKKIFEGDIVSYTEEYESCDYNHPIRCPDTGEVFPSRIRKTRRITAVVNCDIELCAVVVNPISKENYVRKFIKDFMIKELEVIGNIFDNPDLL